MSCQNVWKVYGDNPDHFFSNDSHTEKDPSALSKELSDHGHIVANADVSFDVHIGEIFVIMGLSGSGKSTIVRCLSRLIKPTAGQIFLDEENLLEKSEKELIDIRRHKMGMVFQNFGLLPHLNVIENIAFPLKLQGLKEKERIKKAERVIDLVAIMKNLNDKSIKLLVVGTGSLEKRIKEISQIESLDKQILLVGEKDQNWLSKCLPNCSCFIATHTGRALAEASFAGLPVAGYDIDWHSEIIENNVNGFLVPQGNKKKLALS